MTVKVQNHSADVIKVAINRWGADGSTDDFEVAPNKTESWDRSDPRGFIMVVTRRKARRYYYIHADSDIIVDQDRATDHGRPLAAQLVHVSSDAHLSVKNTSGRAIEVAINRWGNDGETDYSSLGQSAIETWDREDPRGFVMVLRRLGKIEPYFVSRGDEIVVEAKRVTCNDVVIKPLSTH